MSRHDPKVRLRHMLDYALLAESMVAGCSLADLRTNRVLQLALTRAVEVIGEAANRVEPDLRRQLPAIPWDRIIATRNRLAHGYEDIDVAILWDIATRNLPPLVAALRVALDQQTPET